MNTKDTLSETNLEQFYRIKHSLYLFADQKLKLLKHNKNWQDIGNNTPEDIMSVRESVFEKNTNILDEFIEQNPNNFNKEYLKIVESWKKAIVTDKAILFKHTKEHSLFLVNDIVYGVSGLMDSFKDIFEGYSPLFVDIIILPFKDKLVHEGLFQSYNISIGKTMCDGIVAEAEELILKKGIITTFDQQQKETSDEELLRFYMKSEINQDRFFEEIERLKSKSPELKAIYNYEIGRINGRHIKKQLKLQDMKGYFGVLFSQVVASGRTKKELQENLNKLLSEERLNEVYKISIK